MNDDQRGRIIHRERAKQLRDFRGLRFRNITPTDIDGLIEYQNKAYIFIEVKCVGVELPYGQKLALERLCDDLQKTKPTIIIVCQHNTPSETDIDVAIAGVVAYRTNGMWRNISGITVKQMIVKFLEKYG